MADRPDPARGVEDAERADASPGAEEPARGDPAVTADAPAPTGDSGSRDWLGSMLRAVGRSARSSVGPLLIPLIPGMVLVVGASLASDWLRQRQFVSVRHGVEAEAQRLGREFDLGLARRVRVVEAAARATSTVSGDPGGRESGLSRAAAGVSAAGPAASASPAPSAAEEWRLRVQPLAFQDHQFRALVWLDGTLAVREVAPPTARLFSSLYPEDDDLRRVALQAVILGRPRDAAAGFVTGSVVTPGGDRELMIAAPIAARPASRGPDYLAAVVRTRDLIDVLASSSLARGYSVTVYEGPYLLFGPRWEQGGPPAQYARDAEVAADGLAWRVQVWPGEELAHRLESPAPLIVLGLGVATAFLASLSLYLARTPGPTPRP